MHADVGLVVQCIVSVTRSVCHAKAIHIFSASDINVFAICQYGNFNVTLANLTFLSF